MRIIKIANRRNKYYVDGLIAGCFSDNYKEKMKEYNLEVFEKFEDDPWIASLKSEKKKPLNQKQMEKLLQDVQKDPDGKGIPYYYGATDLEGNEFIIFTDDGIYVPIEDAKDVGIEKGLKEEYLDF